MAEDHRKAELTAELARSRRRMSGEFVGLHRALDFPQRAKDAIVKNPVAWAGGAGVVGLLLSKLPARRKLTRPTSDAATATVTAAGKTGLILGALKIAFDLSRPALTRWASQRVSDYMESGRNAGRFPR